MRYYAAVPLAILAACLLAIPQAGRAGSPPAYSYGTNYDYEKVLIFAIPVAPDYYYSVGDGLTPEEREDRIAAAVIKRFEQRFSITDERATRRATPAAPERVTREMFRLVGNAPEGPDRRVLALFNTNCVRCHKPGASKPGNVQLLTADRKLFANPDPAKERRRRERVYESVESGEMPRGGPVCPADEKALLKEWSELVRK